MIVKYDETEKVLEELNQDSNANYYWDGWTICKFKPDPVAIWNKDGVYHSEFGWGTVTRYDVDQDGLWHIDN